MERIVITVPKTDKRKRLNKPQINVVQIIIVSSGPELILKFE